MRQPKWVHQKTWQKLLPELLVLANSSNTYQAHQANHELMQMASRADAFDKLAREKSVVPLTQNLAWSAKPKMGPKR